MFLKVFVCIFGGDGVRIWETAGIACVDWRGEGGQRAQEMKSFVKKYDLASLAAIGSNGHGKMWRNVPEKVLPGLGVGQEVEV